MKKFYTDSNGHTEPNPKFYRTGEKRLKFRQQRVSRKKKGSANRCGFVLDRDWNAAINILKLALSTTGHVGTWVIDPNASADAPLR